MKRPLRVARLYIDAVEMPASTFASPFHLAPTFGNRDAVDHGEHGFGEFGVTGESSLRDLALFGGRGRSLSVEQSRFGGVENVRGQGDGLIELDAEVRQEIGVKRLQHCHTPDQGQQNGVFAFGHLILRGLIARIRALFDGRVE